MTISDLDLGRYRLGWHEPEQFAITPTRGLSEEVVRSISEHKNEPEWMRAFRLRAYRRFERKPMLDWFARHMPDLDFDDIYYYLKPAAEQVADWTELPDSMRTTYERLGIPEAERNYLAGVSAQHDSEVVYHRNREDLAALGILFCDMDTAVREHPDLVRRYLGTVIPPGDNKFAALNSSVWSGGSFVFVPPGVAVPQPLSAYFRINAERAGQFERTLIVAEEGSSVIYAEGCSAPISSRDSLHSAVVELIAKPGSRIEYQTVQSWAPGSVYNLVTKRARVEEGATVRWIDANVGSRLTMKYPSCVLVGERAHGEVRSLAYAGEGQHQDTGAKMIHAASNTTSLISSRSVSKDGGRTSYRGLVHVDDGAHRVRSHVECDALILDELSRSDTYPYMEVSAADARISHEATVSKVGDDQLFYLRSRGLTEAQALAMIVAGFAEPIAALLPVEYSVELTRLLEMTLEDSVG